jgi:hypothetical protein
VLAAQAHRELRGEAAEHLVLRVHDVPAVHDFFSFRGVSLHCLTDRFQCAAKGANSSKKTAQPVENAPNPPICGGWKAPAHYPPDRAAVQYVLSDLKSAY